MVGEPLGLQKAMQPEAFTPRFIATHHRRRFGQTKASFGLGHFLEQALLMPCCDGALAGLLAMARRETKLPGLFTHNWLQVLGTAERSQVDQRVRHQLHAIVPLLDTFKSEQQSLELVFPGKRPLDTHA